MRSPRGRRGGGEPNSSHLPDPVVAVSVCRGLVVPPVVVVVAATSWVVAFPPSLLAVLSVVSPVVPPPPPPTPHSPPPPPSSLAGGIGVTGSCRWGSCPCTGCPVAGSGGGSVGASAAGVDWSIGWAFVCCCECLSVCWLAGVRVYGGRGSAVSARGGPPRAGLCCRPRCWPLVVLGADPTMQANRGVRCRPYDAGPSWC